MSKLDSEVKSTIHLVECVKPCVIRNGLLTNPYGDIEEGVYTSVGILSIVDDADKVFNISGKGVGIVVGMKVGLSNPIASSEHYFKPMPSIVNTNSEQSEPVEKQQKAMSRKKVSAD